MGEDRRILADRIEHDRVPKQGGRLPQQEDRLLFEPLELVHVPLLRPNTALSSTSVVQWRRSYVSPRLAYENRAATLVPCTMGEVRLWKMEKAF